ncbi:tyrosine-type recombinase/integrase [Vibrio parahaemolyticus]|nr:tyrosine-type recombinase/integrase [Vibrio parahaemolyticus]
MYLFKAPNGTYYTRLCLPKSLKDRDFPFDIKASLLTKTRRVAVARNVQLLGVLLTIVDSVTERDNRDTFLSQVNTAIDKIRQTFQAGSSEVGYEAVPTRYHKPLVNPTTTPETVLQAFIESKRQENVTHLTVHQLETRCRYFIESQDITNLSKVSSADAMKYKEHLMKEKKTVKLVRDYLAAIKQFFNWCRLHEKVTAHPFEHIKAPRSKGKAAHADRERWTKAQLLALISNAKFKKQSDSFQWITLLLIAHGCRPAEVCQLKVSDIVLDDEDPVIRITSDGEGQHLKTASAVRCVPLHPAMIESGFLDFVLKRKQQGCQQLFDYAPWGPDNDWSKQFITHFGKYQTSIGMKPKQRPTSYGLRHTVIDELKRQNAPEHVIAELVGHTHQKLTYGRYGKPLDASHLSPFVRDYALPYELLRRIDV